MRSNHTLEPVFVDNPPNMSSRVQLPPGKIIPPNQPVTIIVNVTDLGSGVQNVTLRFSYDNGTNWYSYNMSKISDVTYQFTIPGYDNCTCVWYKIIAYDNSNANATKPDNGYFYDYHHYIPEFPSSLILTLFMIVTLLTAIVYRRKHSASSEKAS